ncbi:hypothetical protein GOODEAATRI_009080, partial [Goodea atripinnis]
LVFLCFVLFVAQNTAESYRICMSLIEEEQTRGQFIPRHAYCFAVALALRRLQQACQVTQQTLDNMLCHAPTGKRKPALIEQERRTSRRTLRPLQSNLLSE